MGAVRLRAFAPIQAADETLNRVQRALAEVLNPALVALESLRPTRVTTVTTHYALASTDGVVAVDATAAVRVVELPPAAGMKDRTVVVKKIDASANAVTVRAAPGEKIDGAATISTTAQWVAYSVASDGTRWYVV